MRLRHPTEDSSREVREKHTKASFQDQCLHLRHHTPGRVGLVQMGAHRIKIEAHKVEIEFHNSMLNLDHNLSTLNIYNPSALIGHLETIRQHLDWKGLKRMVEECVSKCPECQRNKKTTKS